MGYNILASTSSWIEGEAIKQTDVASKLDGMHQVVGMPDLHPGKGFPVGAAFFCDYIYPSLVGSDIGCGMRVSKLNLNGKFNISKWVKSIEKLENEDLAVKFKSELETISKKYDVDYEIALGTVGGGNHFLEIQKVISIKDKEIALKNGLELNDLLMIVHSGSRGLGASILDYYQKLIGFNGLKNLEDQKKYLKTHDNAMQWACANRHILEFTASKILDVTPHLIVDIIHNFVEEVEIDGINAYLHRKGAAASQGKTSSNLGFIPSSRGDLSYIIHPIANKSALFSLPHGAGRKWKRGDCKGRLHNFPSESFLKTKFGSYVICGNKELLFEEAPQAYKKISQVIQDVENFNLASVVAETQPILTYKCPSKKNC